MLKYLQSDKTFFSKRLPTENRSHLVTCLLTRGLDVQERLLVKEFQLLLIAKKLSCDKHIL